MVNFYNAFLISDAVRHTFKDEKNSNIHAVNGEYSGSIRHATRDKSRKKNKLNAVSSELHFSETALE